MKALEVKQLKKHFVQKKWWPPASESKLTKAVNGVSFTIDQGEIVGLLGPNGAGKTTTSQMLLGTLSPTGGEIFYFGQKFFPYKNDLGVNKELLNKINFSSAYIDFPWRMTVWENLDVFARLYGLKNRQARIKKFLKEFDALSLKNKTINQLSDGQKTRVLLAKAFLNHPQLLILDEPTASLDPDIAIRVRKFLIKQQKEFQVAILFTSHNMPEVQEICDQIIFLDKGRIIAQDTPLGLIKRLKNARIKMVITQGKRTLEKYLQQKKINFHWQKEKAIFKLEEEVIPKVLYRLSDQGVRYAEIEILRPSLEDFFLEIVNQNDH